MVGQEQLESSPLCQHSDNETETKRECSVVIPDDWQLRKVRISRSFLPKLTR
ncbi:hypothetical protein NEP43_14580 [Escherichia coli]|nr:hypothetical protein [Escherichia coli]MDI1210011.1 hypothetical protein [Escherichia coli]